MNTTDTEVSYSNTRKKIYGLKYEFEDSNHENSKHEDQRRLLIAKEVHEGRK